MLATFFSWCGIHSCSFFHASCRPLNFFTLEMSLTHVSLLVSFFFFLSMCSFSFRFFRNSLNLSSSSYILRIQYEHVSLARSFNGTHYYTFAYLLLVRSSYFAISVYFFFLLFSLKKKVFKVTYWRRNDSTQRERKKMRKKKICPSKSRRKWAIKRKKEKKARVKKMAEIKM